MRDAERWRGLKVHTLVESGMRAGGCNKLLVVGTATLTRSPVSTTLSLSPFLLLCRSAVNPALVLCVAYLVYVHALDLQRSPTVTHLHAARANDVR